ncbi:MAG: hypothetical protein H7Y09_06500 [Chitinophagaceae bacterium]|nr:hypothetical protein [Anaerolineae bacterium]
MNYKLIKQKHHSGLFLWSHPFFMISTDLFKSVYPVLEFPFDPPVEVQHLAHDIALLSVQELKALGVGVPVESLKTPFNLYEGFVEGLDADTVQSRSDEILFENTFKHLQQLGYAQALYTWGKQSHNFYALEKELTNWSLLLQGNTSIEMLKSLFPSKSFARFEALNARYVTEINQFVTAVSIVKDVPKSIWENFAYKWGTVSGAWVVIGRKNAD